MYQSLQCTFLGELLAVGPAGLPTTSFLAFCNQAGASLPLALHPLLFMVFLQFAIISLFSSCQSTYLKSCSVCAMYMSFSRAVLNILHFWVVFSSSTFYNCVKMYPISGSWNVCIVN